MVYDGPRYARPQQHRDYSRQPPRFYLQLDLPTLCHESPKNCCQLGLAKSGLGWHKRLSRIPTTPIDPAS